MQSQTMEAPSAGPAKAGAGKYLTFSLGQESYGIDILKVREIIRVPDITPVPQMPSCVKGVINLRGKVIPVIDLRVKFQFPQAEFHERTCMIVVCVKLPSSEETFIGLIVDVVEEVVQVNAQDIEATPNFGVKFETHYILGMAKVKGAVKTILDIDQVVTAEALEPVQAAVALAQNGPAAKL